MDTSLERAAIDFKIIREEHEGNMYDYVSVMAIAEKLGLDDLIALDHEEYTELLREMEGK
jgi:hypothetical protein